MRRVVLGTLALGCRGEKPTCDTEAQAAAPAEAGVDGDNMLILVLDDVGVDKLGVYGVHETPSTTPRINALFDEGVRFDRAYASPTCSPTRASMLTGRHPSRHGIGAWIYPPNDTFTLRGSELTFAEVARGEGWSTAAVGKWHLSVLDGHAAELDPQDQGFDHFRGLLANPPDAIYPDGRGRGYWHWERIDDGEAAYTDAYLTTVQVDDALALITTLPEPWIVYVAFSGAHVPLDVPPSELAAAPASDADLDRYDAVLEALDTEIGRLLDTIDDDLRARTTILTMGDNGSQDHAIRPPWDPTLSKGTVFEGGVRVPMAVTGPLVAEPGTVSTALVHAVDVFATVADLVGVDIGALGQAVDGISVLPIVDGSSAGTRQCLLVEQFTPDGDVRRDTLERAVIEDEYKLIRLRHEPDVVLEVGVDPSAEAEISDDEIRGRLRDEMRRYERALR